MARVSWLLALLVCSAGLFVHVVVAQGTQGSILLKSPSNQFEFVEAEQSFIFQIDGTEGLFSCSLLVDGDVWKTYGGVEAGRSREFIVSISPGEHVWSVACENDGASLSSEERVFSVSPAAAQKDPVEKFYVGGTSKYWIYKVNLPLEEEAVVEGVRGKDHVELKLIKEGREFVMDLLLFPPLMDHTKGVQYADMKVDGGVRERLYEGEPRLFDVDKDGEPETAVTLEVVLRTMSLHVASLEASGDESGQVVGGEEDVEGVVESEGSGDETGEGFGKEEESASERGSVDKRGQPEQERNDVVKAGGVSGSGVADEEDVRLKPEKKRIESPASTLAFIVVVVLVIGMAFIIFFVSRTKDPYQDALREQKRNVRARRAKVSEKEVEDAVSRLAKQTDLLSKNTGKTEESRAVRSEGGTTQKRGGVIASTSRRRRR
ncbi:hypothetical protein D6783_05590 [Candidatus Woesearchaeota archaeon]|nr:MAG: hypothetical protein D6783_05590 [Candidatus Woesearchaeota archaeon]